MARPVEFELDQALDAAVEAFRHQGFAGTSIKALERATGLSSGSLYNSFGDKDVIFQQVLGRYVDTVVARRLARHLGQGDPLDGLRALFMTLLDEPGGGSFGCLLTNTAVEFGPAGSEALAGLHRGFKAQEDAFLAAIERLSPGRADAASAARRLLALYQGILVLIRAGYPKEALREAIAFEFDGLKQ
ncbi:TetR/AcrR family transcriptional regulator [Zavarzinia compransoris]|uniref:TetR/AcrR family transcriptional regulator n=1 Tax=Zavarzinia compransoris TaxID=1264899 RepID=A0A317E924_9PROT|nr:TetR/AcrR family transcriptional regulator [Zavarzinia compransoris]PWR21813.1 TetR/AcrR family transcriptional regulator [Zavarzinia compransoris]TDP45387.1 TetR family transcriptional regulator [Zavarzinia compransoris]